METQDIETVDDLFSLDEDIRLKVIIHEYNHHVAGHTSPLFLELADKFPDLVVKALLRVTKQQPLQGWVKLGRPTKSGHRFFRWYGDDDHDGDVAVADNSGDKPHQTDDGTLWIDQNRKVYVGMSKRIIGVYLPVVVAGDNNRESQCSITLTDLVWLLKNGLVQRKQVRIEESLRDLQKVILMTAMSRAEVWGLAEDLAINPVFLG
jgi:hypothetical protein